MGPPGGPLGGPPCMLWNCEGGPEGGPPAKDGLCGGPGRGPWACAGRLELGRGGPGPLQVQHAHQWPFGVSTNGQCDRKGPGCNIIDKRAAGCDAKIVAPAVLLAENIHWSNQVLHSQG